MGERPMISAEREDLRKRIDEVKEKLGLLNSFIADMEKKLRRSTVWQYDPEAFKKMCAEVKEIARRSREEQERREVAKYGRVLTRLERLGMVEPYSNGRSKEE